MAIFLHTRWRSLVKCLSQGHNKRTCRLYHHTILYAERQAGSCEYKFSKVFGMTRPRIEPRIYPFKGGRSNPGVLNRGPREIDQGATNLE